MAHGDAPARSGHDQSRRRTGASALESGQPAVSVSEVARAVTQCSGMARRVVCEGERIARSFACLAEAAERLGEVVCLVNHVTDQTNLLALRAAIAAAPAAGSDDQVKQILARER